MLNRLTHRQKSLIRKYTILTVSMILIVAVFMSIPKIAQALPVSLAEALTSGSGYNETDSNVSVPQLSPIMGETFSAVLGYDYETEPTIPEVISKDAKYVSSVNLCRYSLEDTPKLYLINRTKFSVNLYDYTNLTFPIKAKVNKDPLVLIVHTHGTESYLPEGVDYYNAAETFRSHEEDKTVVAVGTTLADKLNEIGIVTVHDTTMYDKDDFKSAYSKSKAAVMKILAQYPSIKYVIDLHRDAVFTSSGQNQKPLTELDGKKTAQLMFVVGTNEGGANHPNWKKNLTVATILQERINEDYPTLMRPICLRSASFNQQLSVGSMLLEVGSCGNTIEEAKNAVALFATAFADMINDYKS